jgi:hypothetical protein
MNLTTFDFMLRGWSMRCVAALVTAAGLLAAAGALAQTTAPTAAPSAIPPATSASDATPATPLSSPLPVPPVPAVVMPLRSGTFKAAEGDVAVIRARVRSRPVPGTALDEGDRIVTGESGSAVVTLRDGTVLTVGPNAVVDLSRFSFEPTTQRGQFLVNLMEGSIRVVTGLLARINPELFKVHTPTSVVGVRGTDFIVEAAPNPDVRKALP